MSGNPGNAIPTDPGRSGPGRGDRDQGDTGPGGTVTSKTGQGKTGQGNTGQRNTGQRDTGQRDTGQGNASQGSPGPGDPGTADFGFRSVPRADKKPMVRAVFDSVAPRYDVMNDLMSLGVHRLWKREFIQGLHPRPDRTLLDLAGGTGDIALGWLARGGGPAVLSDINASMLDVGRRRAASGRGQISLLVADAETIPLPDACMDRVSMAFGLRNCTDKAAVLREARRVLRPGGQFHCLEFSRVQVAVLAPVYDAWSFRVLPRMGRLVAGDAGSYQYLAESIRTFPDQEALAALMRAAGLSRVTHRNLTGGIAAIHRGWRL